MILFENRDFRIESDVADGRSKKAAAALAEVFNEYRWDENPDNEPVKITADFPDGPLDFIVIYKKPN